MMMMMEFRQSKLSQLRGGSSLNFLTLNALKLSVETKKKDSNANLEFASEAI